MWASWKCQLFNSQLLSWNTVTRTFLDMKGISQWDHGSKIKVNIILPWWDGHQMMLKIKSDWLIVGYLTSHEIKYKTENENDKVQSWFWQ